MDKLMMVFNNSAAFWGFLGLLIPVIVLLLSRQKQKVVEFGSLRFLRETATVAVRSYHPSEWILFLLRSLLLLGVVLFLAKPMFNKKSQSKRVMVEASLYQNEEIQTLINDKHEDVELTNIENYNLFFRQVSDISDSILLYASGLESKFQGSEFPMKEIDEWKVLPDKNPLIIKDSVLINDEPREIIITSNEEGLKWTTNQLAVSPMRKRIGISFFNALDKDFEVQKLKRLLNAYNKVLPLHFDFDSDVPDWTIAIDTTVNEVQSKLISWETFEGPLGIDKRSKEHFEIYGALTSSNLSSSNFSVLLAAFLLEDLVDLSSLDRRVRTEDQVLRATYEKMGETLQRKEYPPLFAIIILLLLMVERFLARNKRKYES